MTSPPSLSVQNLTKSFDGAEGALSILQGVSFEMQAGDAVAVTGPSGSGKSTLLYILGLLDSATSGDVLWGADRPAALSTREQARWRNQKIGFVFQDHHLLPQCSVLENVLLPTLAAEAQGTASEERARQLLDRVGLSARLSHRPAQLSGGERQRVAVCRALVNQPQLLLADEPTGNLDRRSAETVGGLLLEVAREQQVMLICVTHSQDLADRFPRRYELCDGRLEQIDLSSAGTARIS